jgi:hypothetical protein
MIFMLRTKESSYSYILCTSNQGTIYYLPHSFIFILSNEKLCCLLAPYYGFSPDFIASSVNMHDVHKWLLLEGKSKCLEKILFFVFFGENNLIYLLQPSPNEIFVLACIHRAQSNNKKNQ